MPVNKGAPMSRAMGDPSSTLPPYGRHTVQLRLCAAISTPGCSPKS